MIKRFNRYSIKHLKNDVSRIYIMSKNALEKAKLSGNSTISIVYNENKSEITIKLDKNGENKVYETARGPLLELKNKMVNKIFGNAEFVRVTFRDGKVVIQLSRSEKKRIEREHALLEAQSGNRKLRFGSFFSGTGLLTYFLKNGLNRAGIESELCFSLDSSEIAMECSLESNPIWDNASEDAMIVTDYLEELDISELPQSDILEVAYPCVGQSTLCDSEKRDLDHPMAGTLFIKLLAAIDKMNPAVVIFENTPAFKNSKTLDLIKREMKGYNFSEKVFNGHNFGELEERKRVCVIATSAGLNQINIDTLEAPKNADRSILSDHLENISEDSPLWREMKHVKDKESNPKLNFKNKVYKGHEDKIATITATYASPKVGAPMIQHPVNPSLQRQLTGLEHASIRKVPETMKEYLKMIMNGTSPMVSTRGSVSAVHRMLGNSVSRNLWEFIGVFLGICIQKISPIEAKLKPF